MMESQEVMNKNTQTHTQHLPGVVRQQGLVVILQKVLHLAQDIEPPVVQNLSQIRHTSHAHLLSWKDILIHFFF